MDITLRFLKVFSMKKINKQVLDLFLLQLNCEDNTLIFVVTKLKLISTGLNHVKLKIEFIILIKSFKYIFKYPRRQKESIEVLKKL